MIEPGFADATIPTAVADFTVYDAHGRRIDLHMELKTGTVVTHEQDEAGVKHGWAPFKRYRDAHFLRVKVKP